jgi:hypothetical protein
MLPMSLGKEPVMNLQPHFIAVVLLVLLQGCATGEQKPDSVTSPGSDIPAYATFSWPALGGGGATTTTPPLSILDTNIHDAIRAQLIAKGYREVETNPDFIVTYDVAPYQVEKKSSPPVSIGIGVGSWGGNVGGGVGTSVGVGGGQGTESTMNRLTIRAADGKSGKEVWVGTTTSDIKQGLDASAVDKAVAGTMAGFPARRT